MCQLLGVQHSPASRRLTQPSLLHQGDGHTDSNRAALEVGSDALRLPSYGHGLRQERSELRRLCLG